MKKSTVLFLALSASFISLGWAWQLTRLPLIIAGLIFAIVALISAKKGGEDVEHKTDKTIP